MDLAAVVAALIPITLVGGLIGIKPARGARRLVAGDGETAMLTPTAGRRPVEV